MCFGSSKCTRLRHACRGCSLWHRTLRYFGLHTHLSSSEVMHTRIANARIALAVDETHLLLTDQTTRTVRVLSYDEFTPLTGLSISAQRQIRLARSKKDGRVYVIKRIVKQVATHGKMQKIYDREVRILAALKNPFIVTLFGTFEHGPFEYICYEYLAGGTLNFLLDECLRLDEMLARSIAAQIILAFQYLHALNLAYRNLNPDTVLFDRHGFVRLIDFQLMRTIHHGQRATTIKGDIFYCAPEIILRQGHSLEVDWWALGVLIYEMIAGYSPYFEYEGHMTLRSAARGYYRRFPAHFSESLKHLLRALLRNQPQERLGGQGDDAHEVKKHLWFVDFNWDEMYACKSRLALLRSQLQTNMDTYSIDLPNQRLFGTF